MASLQSTTVSNSLTVSGNTTGANGVFSNSLTVGSSFNSAGKLNTNGSIRISTQGIPYTSRGFVLLTGSFQTVTQIITIPTHYSYYIFAVGARAAFTELQLIAFVRSMGPNRIASVSVIRKLNYEAGDISLTTFSGLFAGTLSSGNGDKFSLTAVSGNSGAVRFLWHLFPLLYG
jgi:hypothetical protein